LRPILWTRSALQASDRPENWQYDATADIFKSDANLHPNKYVRWTDPNYVRNHPNAFCELDNSDDVGNLVAL